MKIRRIIYGAPPSDTPAGGVKVIYQQSELLNQLGVESAIWHPANESFQCSWFENNINKVKFSDLKAETDLIVVPEIWASTYVAMLKNYGFKVGIYVQNCYYTHVNLNSENKNSIQEAYELSDIVLSISKDTTNYLTNILNIPEDKIILQRYSINNKLFAPKDKRKIITYMPRKMADHSTRVVSALSNILPSEEWVIQPIHNMNEQQVADALSHSIIFLAFSEFEGLPVPPVEAALSGNFVIGYDGQGGKEYWQLPNFHKIEQGNIQDFILKATEIANEIECKAINIEEINHGIQTLSNYFSKENEIQMIRRFVSRSNSLSLVSGG